MWGRKNAAEHQQAPERQQSLFNILGKNICRDVLTRLLTADEIEAVMKTSWSMRELFKGSNTFQMQRDASALLKFAMSANLSYFNGQFWSARVKYRKDVWRLLLTRTRGVEQRGKRWEAISAVEFAACSGNLSDNGNHHYLLNWLLSYIPEKYRHIALQQIADLIEFGTMQYGECRGVLSAVADLDARYTRYIDDYDIIGSRRSEKYWRKHVVPYQEKLPEIVVQELCRQINFLPVPDFKNLQAPPPAQKLDGSAPFARPALTVRKWGLFHGNNHGAHTAMNERGSGIGWIEPKRDRDVLRTYSKAKKEQLVTLLDEQRELIADLDAVADNDSTNQQERRLG